MCLIAIWNTFYRRVESPGLDAEILESIALRKSFAPLKDPKSPRTVVKDTSINKSTAAGGDQPEPERKGAPTQQAEVPQQVAVLQRLADPQRLLERLRKLEGRLMTSDVGPPSDSDCQAMNPKAPANLGRDDLRWVCNFSRTFVFQDRERRTLDVKCDGKFKVNFVNREEDDSLRKNGKYVEDPVWEEHTGPTVLPFKTKYADVECNGQHNYRTQLVPDPAMEVKQRELYNQFVKGTELRPLSFLSISIDAVSRAQMYRSFGLPRTAGLLKRLYYASVTNHSETASVPLTHQAFLFNRLNSISGYTAMNLVPMYAGELFTMDDERERVRHSKFVKPVKEWVWQYAAKRGYITSYAVDTGNGLFGTRTVCKDCHYRPGCLPHWEHGWVTKENTVLKDGVLSGFCEGDGMVFDYIMNYSRQVLQRDHPAKWVAFDSAVHHRPEPEAINQMDESLSVLLETVLQENENLVVLLFGDHGKPYTKFPDHIGGHYETLLPFFTMILPLHALKTRPDIADNLLENSQRLISFFDVHTTIKSLIHFPHVEKVEGHLSHEGINLLTSVISPHRSCAEAGIPDWSCACSVMREMPESEWTPEVQKLVDKAIDDINKQHKTEAIVSSEKKTTCQDVQLDKVQSVFVSESIRKTLGPKRSLERETEFTINFAVVQGPATFKLVITRDHIVSLKQMTRYAKYKECHDERVSIEFCICKNFPKGTL